MYIITTALTYPIPLFVVRHIFYAIYIRWKHRSKQVKDDVINADDDAIHDFEEEVNYGVEHASLGNHLLFSCTIFFSTLTISMFVDNLGVAMSIIGSISSINLAFVFPPLFYIKATSYNFRFWNIMQQMSKYVLYQYILH